MEMAAQSVETTPLYFEKELSWLSFNERVLQEAKDKTNPIIERIRFLGIFSNNLDEFFKVRVADVKRRILLDTLRGVNSSHHEELLHKIQNKVLTLNGMFDDIYKQILIDLARYNIHISKPDQLSETSLNWLKSYFIENVLDHMTPIKVSDAPEKKIHLKDSMIYILVELISDRKQYAALEVPSIINRFVNLPTNISKKEKHIVLLDDIILYFLSDIFVGLYEFDDIKGYSFKLTRDAEYNIDNEEDEGLLDKMSKGLKQRLNSEPTRLVYDSTMPDNMLKILRKKLGIKDYDATIGSGRYRNFRDFIGFPNVGRSYLENKPLPSLINKQFAAHNNVFKAISEKDILLYYPYHTFNHLTEYLRQASYDPRVTQIKINIYRVARQSRVINALINAARNGKKVTVMVELKARFDEENNIEWSKLLKEAGIKVIYGIASLKVHSKLCLVYRKEKGEVKKYAHIGTGNFHEKTANVYTDFSLFTKNQEITEEASQVFKFIEYSYKKFTFNHLLVSPVNAREKTYNLIENEIEAANQKEDAEIILKVNNLVDKGLIDKLYEASNAGVKIRIIVRGMCSLIPNIRGISDNIRIISIVDRFLEHPRVMVFHNRGDKRVYISSADWMTRNLDHRVEVGTPIYDNEHKETIIEILELQFRDRAKSRLIDSSQRNYYVRRGNKMKLRSQTAIYDYLKKRESA